MSTNLLLTRQELLSSCLLSDKLLKVISYDVLPRSILLLNNLAHHLLVQVDGSTLLSNWSQPWHVNLDNCTNNLLIGKFQADSVGALAPHILHLILS